MALDHLIFFQIFFFMWAIFKSFFEFVTILLLFHVFGYLAIRHMRSQL